MPLGGKALYDIAKKDKKMKAAIRVERDAARVYQMRLNAAKAELNRSNPKSTGARVVVNVYATDKGYAVHLNVDGRIEMLVKDVEIASAWQNTLLGLLAVLEKIPQGSAITFILHDSGIASLLHPDELWQRQAENWIDIRTGKAKAYAEEWRRIHKLLKGHCYVARGDREMKSPIMADCKAELRKRPENRLSTTSSGHN